MTEQLVSLRLISDNPYQPRSADDPEHIEKLARSIAADDLLQKPSARKFGNNGAGIIQLAFGHSRRKAFEWLQEHWQAEGLPDRYAGYSKMPVDVAELSDEEMYRQAISENVQRKDLNPIELAQAMVKYRDEFKKSSEQVGELFGLNGATVRGLVRFLELPGPVKEKVASGEITQGAARKLLTIARVDESQVKQAVVNLQNGMSAEDAVDSAMRDSDSAFLMWFGWRDGAPLAGDHLWRIDAGPDKFPMKHLPRLTAAQAAQALGIEFTAQNRPDLEKWISILSTGTIKGFDGVAEKIEGSPVDYLVAQGAPADQIEKLVQLLTPPACSACAFHSVSDKQHFCGFKPCHQRKKKAFVEAEMQKVAKRIGIAVHDPAKDGKTTLPLAESTYEDHYAAHAKLVKDKDPDLRLGAHTSPYNAQKWTDSYHVRVVLVGKKATAVKEKKRAAVDQQQAKEEARKREYALQRARDEAARKFYHDHVPAIFAPAFKKMDHVVALCHLLGVGQPKKGAKASQVLADLHVRLADRAIDDVLYDWQTREKGPVAIAKKAQSLAATWGVKAPANLLEIAQGYEPVSTETKGQPA